MTCDGADLIDKELIGPIALLPQEGFDEKYITNHNIKGWLSPLVAIHFRKPTLGKFTKIKKSYCNIKF